MDKSKSVFDDIYAVIIGMFFGGQKRKTLQMSQNLKKICTDKKLGGKILDNRLIFIGT